MAELGLDPESNRKVLECVLWEQSLKQGFGCRLFITEEPPKVGEDIGDAGQTNRGK